MGNERIQRPKKRYKKYNSVIKNYPPTPGGLPTKGIYRLPFADTKK